MNRSLSIEVERLLVRSLIHKSDCTSISHMGFLVLMMAYEPWHEISNNLVCATSRGSDQPAHTRRLIRAFAGRLNIL